VAAAAVLFVLGDGSRTVQLAFDCGSVAGQCTAVPIDLGPPEDQAYLSLYGTGIRNYSSLSEVDVWIGGEQAEVLYAGPQGQYSGLDQVNVRIPKTLAGHGDVVVRLLVGGKAANPATVSVGKRVPS
jgi:uncharacterized protein (TIGR03437 family)